MHPTRDIRLVKGPDSDTAQPQYYAESWALVIGIDRYRDASARLANARNDAEAVAELLVNHYHFEHVHTLYDEEATKDALLTWLRDRLPAEVKRDDRLIIFFAGHGTTREGGAGQTRGYLIPYDAEFNRFADYVDMAELRDACGWIPAKHILIILDCCFSGIAAVTARSTVTPNVNVKLTDHYLQRITERGAWQVLTAGALDELVADSGSRPGHSAFTSALLAGLEGAADLNHDSVITASDLAAYVKPEVSRESTQAGGRGQIPFFSYLAGSDQGDFVLIKPGETPRLAAVSVPPMPNLRANSKWLWGGLGVVIAVVALMSWFVWSSQQQASVAQAALTSIIGTMTQEATEFEAQQQATLAAVTAAPQPTRQAIMITQAAEVAGTTEANAPVLTAASKGEVPEAQFIATRTPTPNTANGSSRMTPNNQVVTPADTVNSSVIEGIQVVIDASVVNIRSGPGTQYSVIASAERGETYEVVGKDQASGWWQVQSNGKLGWVSGSVVSVADSETVPIVQDSLASTPSPTQVTALGEPMEIELSIIDESDDAEERASEVDLGSHDLEMSYDTDYEHGSQIVGIRFQNVGVPRGSLILNAYLQFVVHYNKTNSEQTSLVIMGEASDNASPFTTDAFNLSLRSTTTAVSWPSVPEWNESGLPQKSPDIRQIIQEIVNRDAWQSGNAIAFIIEGPDTSTNFRNATSFEGSGEARITGIEEWQRYQPAQLYIKFAPSQ